MKKFLFVVFLFVGITTAESQQLLVEAGKTISSFEYSNSKGNNLENIQPTNHTYLSLGYRTNIFTKNLFLDLKFKDILDDLEFAAQVAIRFSDSQLEKNEIKVSTKIEKFQDFSINKNKEIDKYLESYRI